MTKDNPDCGMKRAARVDSYRGFVFASLVDEGPALDEFLGEAKIAFDDMCDRSPLGEVEVVPICHRVMQHSNWKFFMENQLDALHPSVTHQSTGISAGRVEKRLKAEKGAAPLYYHYLSTFASSFEQWDARADDQLPARPRHPQGVHGPAPARPRHARVRGAAEGRVRRGEDRGVPVAQHPPRARLSLPLGAVAAAAAALPAPGRPRQDDVGDLALPPEGRARGDLPAEPLVLQPRQLAGDDDQRRRPRELDQGPVGPGVERRRLGELSPLLRRRPRGERRHLLEPRHVGSGDAQPVQGVVELHAGRRDGDDDGERERQRRDARHPDAPGPTSSTCSRRRS